MASEGNKCEKTAATRKAAVQNKMWKSLGLRIDYPSPCGSGSSNDGNTARRAFQNHKEFVNILELDETLIFHFKSLLLTLSHSFPIDKEKFGAYCTKTFNLYVEKYSWYYMSPTLHKIMAHGKDIIQSCVLPILMYSK